MSAGKGLKAQWGLKEAKAKAADGGAGEFRERYREQLAVSGRALKAMAAAGSAKKLAALAEKHKKAYQVYQKVMGSLDEADPKAAEKTFDKAMAWADGLAVEAEGQAKEAEAARKAWETLAKIYDKASEKIEALDQAGHEAAAKLLQALERIAAEVDARNWTGAGKLLGTLTQSLDPLYEGFRKQAQGPGGGAVKGGGDGADSVEAGSDQQRQAYQHRLRTIRRTLDRALSVGRDYDNLDRDRQELQTTRDAMFAAARSGNYGQAGERLTELEQQLAAYNRAADREAARYQARAEEIGGQLDEAAADQRGAVARQVLDGLSDDEARFLPTATRNRLQEAMLPGRFTDEEKASARRLYRGANIDPAFEEAEGPLRRQLAEALRNDPEIQAARGNWDNMDQRERLAILQELADHQMAVYQLEDQGNSPSLRIVPEDIDPHAGEGPAMSVTNGHYDHDDGTLTINTNDSRGVAFNDFDAVLETMLHEVGHRYQQVLAGQYIRGELQPGDTVYDQALAFHLNRINYEEAGDPANRQGYRNQPMEAHARVSARDIRRALDSQQPTAAD